MVLAAPHPESAAEAHDPVPDAEDAGLPPGFEEAVHRPAPVELLDVRAEKSAHSPPGRAGQHAAGGGHQPTRVQAPAGAPHRVGRHEKIKAGHAAVWPQHASQLNERRGRVGDVTQEICEGDCVERRIRKRQLFCPRLLEVDALVEPRVVDTLFAALQHRLADVHAHDVCFRRARQRHGNSRCPGRHVEDSSWFETDDVSHELAPPPAVLAQRKDLGHAVVASRQTFEEICREGVLGALGRRAGLCHGRHQSTGTWRAVNDLPLMRSLVVAAALALATIAPMHAEAASLPLLASCQDRTDVTDGFSYRFCGGMVPTFDGVALDTDLTLPAGRTPNDGYPLLVMMHGWGGSKTYWESGDFCTTSSADACNYNNLWFAHRGYAVVTLTARGFHASQSYTHLADMRWEVHDTQYLAGLLVDAGVARPGIGVTGLSYGAGQAWLLAVLADRVMNPDGTLTRWRSPAGTPLRIAAAVPKYTWSDLVDALQPNGRASDGVLTHNGDRTMPFGIEKKSYVDYFYQSGLQSGRYAAPGQDPTADMTTWYTEISAGETPAQATYAPGIIEQIARYRSAYYQDSLIATDVAGHSETPVFAAQGWTDSLFPESQAVTMIEKLRAADPRWPSYMYASDLGHPLANNNKLAEWRPINQAATAFL